MLTIHPGTALLAISQITRPPLLAFVTIIVPESAREDLYGLTQLVENVTSLVAGPILQNLLRIALRWPQGWWGLPFVFASVSRQLYNGDSPSKLPGHVCDSCYIFLASSSLIERKTGVYCILSSAVYDDIAIFRKWARSEF